MLKHTCVPIFPIRVSTGGCGRVDGIISLAKYHIILVGQSM